MVLLSAPFPGNVYGAFRIAQSIKQVQPSVVTVLGGGYCNTELREMSEPRVFDHFDFVSLDAGERPLLALHRTSSGQAQPREQLVRTFTREGGGRGATSVRRSQGAGRSVLGKRHAHATTACR